MPPGRTPPPEVKNGRIYAPNITLKNLIQAAWDLNDDSMLVGAPKWLDQDRFDVIAKAPSDVALGSLTPQQRDTAPVNIDALRPMLRNLLKDKFQLQVHTEERPLNAWVLTAAKPKLNKADPKGRTRWHEGVATDAKDTKNANPTLGRLVTCTNVTMAQFADMLPLIAPGYVRTEVKDETGLDGGWDFTFSFSPAGAVQSLAPSSEGEASTPSSGISLPDAMMKQLGLKLEQQKRPYTVLVIDHVEQKPKDN
jgi:uncharacterized protein (TIGR03435 family)